MTVWTRSLVQTCFQGHGNESAFKVTRREKGHQRYMTSWNKIWQIDYRKCSRCVNPLRQSDLNYPGTDYRETDASAHTAPLQMLVYFSLQSTRSGNRLMAKQTHVSKVEISDNMLKLTITPPTNSEMTGNHFPKWSSSHTIYVKLTTFGIHQSVLSLYVSLENILPVRLYFQYEQR